LIFFNSEKRSEDERKRDGRMNERGEGTKSRHKTQTIPFRELSRMVDSLGILVRTKLWAQIIVGMVLGITVGLLLAPTGAHILPENIAYIIAGWLVVPGHIFLALIQMVILPLVISSIILGITSSGDFAYLRKVGLRIAPYFVGTTTVAVTIGIFLAMTIQPGNFIDSSLVDQAMIADTSSPQTVTTGLPETTLPEKIVALIPSNPISAALDKSMLQIVVMAIFIGIALVSIPARHSRIILELAGAVQEVSMKVVSWAMMLAPLAVFGLLADITIKIGLDALLGMGVYVGTVLLGLLCLLGFYLLIVAVIGRRSPWDFLRNIGDAQLLAFSTSSSAAVMPLSMKTAQDRLGVKPAIAKFIIPLGATVNMDGTALYQVVAAVFLTQVYGVELTFGKLILLTATTVGASIGSPSTPGVGIVILATILEGIGVPSSGIALIIGVDRILDMSRTAVNVSGDLTACVVMDRWLADTVEGDPAISGDEETSPPAVD
jgi:Na+/H+-dicarboxylate symporter